VVFVVGITKGDAPPGKATGASSAGNDDKVIGGPMGPGRAS